MLKISKFLNFVLSVNYKKAKIKNYFKDGKKFNIKVNMCLKKNLWKFFRFIKFVKIKNRLPIIVTNGDIFSNIKLLRTFRLSFKK